MFTPVSGFSFGDVGLYWGSVRQSFTSCVAQEALPHAIESRDQEQSVTIQLTPNATIPRAVFRHENGAELIQLQDDRFSFNWMLTEGEEYPRHDETIRRFWGLFDGFNEYLRERGLQEPTLIQCELTNVNIIPLSDFDSSLSSALAGLNTTLPTTGDDECLQLEAVKLAMHRLILDPAGGFRGRVHSELQPVRNLQSNQEAIRLDITARGEPRNRSRAGAVEFFEMARSAINATFLGFASEDARKVWGEVR